MPTTIKAASTTAPDTVIAPLVFVRQLWSDEWTVRPDLRLTSATALVAGMGVGSAEFRRPFGPAVKFEYESVYSAKTTLDILDWWVFVLLPSKDGGSEFSWIGRISTESREVHAGGTLSNGDPDPTPAGVQTWIAHEPLRLLERKPFAQAVFRYGSQNNAVHRHDWLPDMNAREPGSGFAGNRSYELHSPGGGIAASYVFRGRIDSAGTKAVLWSHLDFLQYVLSWFADYPVAATDGSSTGPYFQITGARNALAELKTTIRFKRNGAVADALRKIIPREAGLDYKILPILATGSEGQVEIPGFEINVYPTSPVALYFATASLPANTDRVDLNLRDIGSATARMVNTLDNQYDGIRVRGERIVVCATLRFQKPAQLPLGRAFIPGWDTAEPPDNPNAPVSLQLQYTRGTGTEADSAKAHDTARQNPRYRDVYSRFVLPENALLDKIGLSAPVLSSDGTPIGGLYNSARSREFQLVYRELLPWIPLRNGFDYSTPTPTPRFDAVAQSGFRSLTVYVFDRLSADGTKGTNEYRRAEDLGLSVSIDSEAWGILIGQTPRHRLGYNEFGWDLKNADDDVTETKTTVEPRWKWQSMLATLAMRTDKRLEVSVDYSPADLIKPERELVIDVPGAEMWVLAVNTIVAIDSSNAFVRRGPELLRDDSERLHAVMAGAIGRYVNARRRAVIDIHGIQGWSTLLGKILSVVEAPAETLQVDAPITSIEYTTAGTPSTVIKTGFAG